MKLEYYKPEMVFHFFRLSQPAPEGAGQGGQGELSPLSAVTTAKGVLGVKDPQQAAKDKSTDLSGNSSGSANYGSLPPFRLFPMPVLADSLGVKLTITDKAWVMAQAERQGVSQGEVVRQAIEAARVQGKIQPMICQFRGGDQVAKEYGNCHALLKELKKEIRSYRSATRTLPLDEAQKRAEFLYRQCSQALEEANRLLRVFGGLHPGTVFNLKAARTVLAGSLREGLIEDPSLRLAWATLIAALDCLGFGDEL